MKREIKFRVWERSEMVYIDDLYWFEENYYHSTNDNSWPLMQYTGLKDKNGKEIYEEDILKSESWGKGSRKPPNEYHVTEWGKAEWVARGYNGEMIVRPNLTIKKDFEVIGNIYENPELL